MLQWVPQPEPGEQPMALQLPSEHGTEHSLRGWQRPVCQQEKYYRGDLQWLRAGGARRGQGARCQCPAAKLRGLSYTIGLSPPEVQSGIMRLDWLGLAG